MEYPVFVVLILEVEKSFPQLLGVVECFDPEEVLLEDSYESLSTTISLRFPDKGGRRLDAEEGDLPLEHIGDELATMVGLGLMFVKVDPVAALYYSAVINGVVAVPLLVIIFLIGNSKKIVGARTSGKLSNSLLIITALLMAGAVVGMFLL